MEWRLEGVWAGIEPSASQCLSTSGADQLVVFQGRWMGKVTVHANEWKATMNGWVNMSVSTAVVLARRRKWALLKQGGFWMAVKLCGFTEYVVLRDLWCLFDLNGSADVPLLYASENAVNCVRVSRVCNKCVKIEVVRCAWGYRVYPNNMTACPWRHHCGFDANVSGSVGRNCGLI